MEFNMDIFNPIRLGMAEEAAYEIVSRIYSNCGDVINGSDLERIAVSVGYGIDDYLIDFVEKHGITIY